MEYVYCFLTKGSVGQRDWFLVGSIPAADIFSQNILKLIDGCTIKRKVLVKAIMCLSWADGGAGGKKGLPKNLQLKRE